MDRRAVVAGLMVAATLGWGCGADALRAQAAGDQKPAVSNADGKIVEGPPPAPKTQAELTAQAWRMLSDAMADDKHHDLQIQALSALGTMGSNARSMKMIEDAFKDSDVDVRTAAVLAAGQTKSRSFVPLLRKALDDKEPQVAYTAAVTLWRMGDHSGGDLLAAVVDGERKAGANLVDGSVHAANKELHDPAALAKMGALQGASMLLGPFGFGITAYEYIRKNGGDSSRVTALELIAQTKTPQVRDELLDALNDKDQAVRAAAAKALASYREPKVSHAIGVLLDDTKRPVQFAAAAAYLISSGAVALPPSPPTDKL